MGSTLTATGATPKRGGGAGTGAEAKRGGGSLGSTLTATGAAAAAAAAAAAVSAVRLLPNGPVTGYSTAAPG